MIVPEESSYVGGNMYDDYYSDSMDNFNDNSNSVGNDVDENNTW